MNKGIFPDEVKVGKISSGVMLPFGAPPADFLPPPTKFVPSPKNKTKKGHHNFFGFLIGFLPPLELFVPPISHDKLLHQLNNYGVRGNSLELIKIYLTDSIDYNMFQHLEKNIINYQ